MRSLRPARLGLTHQFPQHHAILLTQVSRLACLLTALKDHLSGHIYELFLENGSKKRLYASRIFDYRSMSTLTVCFLCCRHPQEQGKDPNQRQFVRAMGQGASHFRISSNSRKFVPSTALTTTFTQGDSKDSWVFWSMAPQSN